MEPRGIDRDAMVVVASDPSQNQTGRSACRGALEAGRGMYDDLYERARNFAEHREKMPGHIETVPANAAEHMESQSRVRCSRPSGNDALNGQR